MDNSEKYIFHLRLDTVKAQLPFEGSNPEIDLSPYPNLIDETGISPMNVYLHIDLELLDPDEEDVNLLVEISTVHGEYNDKNWFSASDIQLFRDGNRLHLAPIDLKDLINERCRRNSDGKEILILELYRNNEDCGKYGYDLTGIPKFIDDDSNDSSPSNQFTDLDDFQGWSHFKQHVKRMKSSYYIDEQRDHAGLTRFVPQLHTAIVGNPGTGKTTAAQYLAQLYHSLGYLNNDTVTTTSVSELASSNINSETENINSLISDIMGGTLVFENAHYLHNPETKNGYNTEGRIVRALEKALDGNSHRKWMLVLVGEPAGISSLLVANPNLKKYFPEPILLDDFKPEELYNMVDNYCSQGELTLSEEAHKKLEAYILHKYNHRGPDFENAWLIPNIFGNQILPMMFERLSSTKTLSKEQLQMILPEDIPSIQNHSEEAMQELENLVGLGKIKKRVKDYLNAVHLAARRMELGLPTNLPRLHMAFLGNPGTGKTTVAGIIGKVFASWGILSGGRVIQTEKSKMVGLYIGETELKMRELLAQARGNILFIDEAYQLVEGPDEDYGRIVMNSLLTELGKEAQDMVVILAGYTAPMKKLLESNEGIESRFPNVFNFEDYTADELVEIGKLMIKKQGMRLTEGAETNMRAIIQEEMEKPSPLFGNGRFVSNLLQNEILASMGTRTASLKNPTVEDLSTILPEDVVVGKAQKDVVFDDVAIDAALGQLDNLVGLTNVKKAIHNFVKSARYLHSIGEPYVGKGLLSWRFVGKSGTGKSTVAEIMAIILKGMRLISNSHITEIKGERIFNVSEMDCDKVLRDAVKKSCNGLIFIDVDTRSFMNEYNYVRTIERIRLKMGELTVEAGGECALILAELDAPNMNVAEQLLDAGIYEFDHTLVFKDFTAEELYSILCVCLGKYNVSFNQAAEKHMLENLKAMRPSIGANARTMKLMSRAIYQQVILRESGLTRRPKQHQVILSDIEALKWNGKNGRIGF